MEHKLPELPYSKEALMPNISGETLEYHYGKHHQAYVDNLNRLIPGTEFENLPLEDIVKKASGGIFNNAAQVWNHSFYWRCMKPGGGGEPDGKLAEALDRDFGSFSEFKEKLTEAALEQFGSGWAWLVESAGALKVVRTANADLPLRHGMNALLTIDVWEHAYYIDYRNARAKYVAAFLDSLVDWDFAASNYASTL